MRSPFDSAWMVLVPVGLSVVVHGSVLDHFFFFDDFMNLYELRTSEPLDFVIRPHAGHLSIVRNLVFYLTYAVAGLDPRPYFASVLAIHALNVVLVFGVIRRFSGRTGAAVLAAGLWGVAPVQQGALGWYAVFGHAHALLFLLLVLWDLAGHERDGRSPSWARLVGWSALLVLGSTTFGVGVAVALVSGPAIYLLLHDDPRRGRILIGVGSSVIVVFLLHVGLRFAYGGVEQMGGMLPAAVHPDALSRVPLLILHLVAFGAASLLAGPLTWTGQAWNREPVFLGSVDELWMLAFAVTVVAAALVGLIATMRGRRLRLRLSALLLLVFGSYGLIAIGRWWLANERGFQGVAVETRYHYLATALLAIGLGLVLAELRPSKPAQQRAALALGTLWLAGAAGLGWKAVRTDGWRDITHRSHREYDKVVDAISRTARDAPEGAHPRLPNLPLEGMVAFNLGVRFPNWAGVHIIAFPEGGLEDRRVRYVEFRQDVRSRLRAEGHRRAARLVVRPNPGEKAPTRQPVFRPVWPR
jgi:hypothetical protein